MKKKLILATASMLALTSLLFVGCSKANNTSSNLKGVNSTYQTSNSPTSNTASSINKDAKSITDNDLLKSGNEDSSTQLDSIDDDSQQLSSDEIDSLLNDNSDLKNISSNFSAK